MKVITVTPSQMDLNDILEQAREDDLMLQTEDGTQFFVSAVDDFDLEIIQTRKNKELMALLDERARQPATIPLEEIERELGLG
jgi:GH43 family beta-xylosidase